MADRRVYPAALEFVYGYLVTCVYTLVNNLYILLTLLPAETSLPLM